MTTDATTEDLGWEPLLNRPTQIAAGVLVAAFVPCFSISTTSSTTINGVTTSHTTDYGAMAFAGAAIAAAGWAGIIGATTPDRKPQRVAIAAGIGLLAVVRLIWAAGVL